MKRHEVTIIIVAAGNGSRFGSELPKQYCMLEDKPVLCHTVERFSKCIPDANIIVVVGEEMTELWKELANKYNTPSGTVITGGTSRWESVRNALLTINNPDSIVLVHDGARPLVTSATINSVIQTVRHGCSVVPVVPVTNSLRYIEPNGQSVSVNRSEYRSVVTPQGFMASDLIEAYRLPFSPLFTDDASVMSAYGYKETILVDSESSNIKITNPGDLALAAWYLTNRTV